MKFSNVTMLSNDVTSPHRLFGGKKTEEVPNTRNPYETTERWLG